MKGAMLSTTKPVSLTFTKIYAPTMTPENPNEPVIKDEYSG